MQYDHIRLAFSVVLLGVGLILIIADLWSRRLKTSSSPVQTVKFGPVEVSTTSLGLAIIALGIPIMLLSRLSVTEAEQRGKEQLVAPLLKAYESSINAYFDLQKKTVRDVIDRVYLPQLVKIGDKSLSSSQGSAEQTQVEKLIQEMRNKERESLLELDDDRDKLLQSANKYINEALRGDAKASLTTLDDQISAKQEKAARSVAAMIKAVEAAINIMPLLLH